MKVPDFQSLMRPLLGLMTDGQTHSVQEIRARLAEEFKLTPQALEERIPSGRVTVFQNRVGWAITYLFRSGLLERSARSIYRITPRGAAVLAQNPDYVGLKVLSQFEEYLEFKTKRSDAQGKVVESADDADIKTPEEQIAASYEVLRSALASDLLDLISEQPPAFFEQLVLDVLQAMGYGGEHENSVERLGQSGDEGVDGVIREDELGLDLIYVQAKRWKDSVGRPEVQKFFGALHGKRAHKGVLITTSSFSSEAKKYADDVTPRVVLVDGAKLARLMIDNGVGVATVRRYAIKRIDSDYFTVDGATDSAAG